MRFDATATQLLLVTVVGVSLCLGLSLQLTAAGVGLAEPSVDGPGGEQIDSGDGAAGADDAGDGASGDDDAGDGAASDDGDGTGGADDGGGSGSDDGGGADDTGSSDIGFSIEELESCGLTCRDATVALTNERSRALENVTAEVVVSTGGEVVHEKTVAVGTIPANDTVRETYRIDVGFSGGTAIQENGGAITVEATIRYDGGSQTVTSETNVLES